jgi:hypothetical protein
MKKVLFILMILPFMTFAQEVEDQVMTMTQFNVKQGHSAQFKDGVKKWKECYTENNGEGSWNFWTRVQGTGSVYGVTTFMDNWAEMDESDPAGKECYAIVMNFIMPHVESVDYNLAKTMPAWSRKTAPSETKLIWVTYYKVDDTSVFSDVIKEVSSTIAEVEGDARGYWYRMIGGDRDNADYFVSSNYSSYAELDIDRDSPYNLYLKAKGEKKTEKMDKMWESAGVESWSYIFEYDASLSK